jgi:hypothetical protein
LLRKITSKKGKEVGDIDQHQAFCWSIYYRKNECICKVAGSMRNASVSKQQEEFQQINAVENIVK